MITQVERENIKCQQYWPNIRDKKTKKTPTIVSNRLRLALVTMQQLRASVTATTLEDIQTGEV